MRRDFVSLIALAFTLVFPSPGFAQSTTSVFISKSPRIDVKALVGKANSGNPEAQYQLGLAYDRGLGVERREYEAMRCDGIALLPTAVTRKLRIIWLICMKPDLTVSRMSRKRSNGTDAVRFMAAVWPNSTSVGCTFMA